MKNVFLAIGLTMSFVMPVKASATDDATKVRALKKEIVALAESYRGEDDPKGERQDNLNKKISKLLKVAPQTPSSERTRRIAGAWEQVWGPYNYENQGPLKTDPSYIYQIVDESGFYYNITRSEFDGQKITAFLRGEFDPEGDRLRIRFTSNIFYVNGWLPKGTSLTELARLVEGGILNGPEVPSGGQGPKGKRGFLREVFVDDEIRITYGSEENDAPGTGNLYVLKRVKATK